MLRLPKMGLALMLLMVLGGLLPLSVTAQDDPNDTPLGDVARTLRKKTPQTQEIDNDNLPQVMDQIDGKHPSGSALKFLMQGESRGFHVSAPDVTCSLSFTASTKALLSSQYAQMDLPSGDVMKLTGPATIEGDAITVSVFNGTEWHVSEVTVALTIVKKKLPADEPPAIANAAPSVVDGLALVSKVRPEKKPDVTVIYKMRSAAPPWTNTVFSSPLNLDLTPGDEWHWAIVQARGYPPQNYSGAGALNTAQTNGPAIIPPIPPAPLWPPPNSAQTPQSQNPQ